MTILSLLLVFKITVSIAVLIIPFLFFSKEKLAAITKTTADTSQLYRLYGIAILALLVAYGFGIAPAQAGIFPWGVVAMGIVSNVGAALCMLVFGVNKQNIFGIVLFGTIGLGLIAAAIMPGVALVKIW